jgi:hypothetical protein
VVDHRAGWLDPVFVALSQAGAFGAVWLGLALGLALARRQPRLFLCTAAVLLAAELVARGLKEVVGPAAAARPASRA